MYNHYHTIMLLMYGDTVLGQIEYGTTYQLPVDVDPKDLHVLKIGVPPQSNFEDIIQDNTNIEIHTRPCTKCDKGIQKNLATCCTERNLGFLSKWLCDQCNHTIYSRKEVL